MQVIKKINMEYDQTAPKHDLDPVNSPEARRQIETAAKDIEAFLRQENLDPEQVLLRGGTKDRPPMLDRDGEPRIFFGTVEDLHPAPDEASEEERGEHWVSNPIKHALEANDRGSYGVIAVFDKASILATPGVDWGEDEDDGYGTVIANREYFDDMRHITSINVVCNPDVVKLSQKEFDAIDWDGTIADGQQDVGGIPVNVGIIRLEIQSSDGTVTTQYCDTSVKDFGTNLRNVVEIGREMDYMKEKIDLGSASLRLAEVDQPANNFGAIPTNFNIKLVPENIVLANERISWILDNPNSNEALRTIFQTLGATPEEIRAGLDPNNGNVEARRQVQAIIERQLDKLGEQSQLPDQLQRRAEKSPNIPADLRPLYKQDKYPSREYAAMLGLAMLDGTYKLPREWEVSMTQEELKKNGETNDMQHRRGAEMALRELGMVRSEKKAEQEQQFDDLGNEITKIREMLVASDVNGILNRGLSLLQPLDDQLRRGQLLNTKETIDSVDYLSSIIVKVEQEIVRVRDELRKFQAGAKNLPQIDQDWIADTALEYNGFDYQLISAVENNQGWKALRYGLPNNQHDIALINQLVNFARQGSYGDIIYTLQKIRASVRRFGDDRHAMNNVGQ